MKRFKGVDVLYSEKPVAFCKGSTVYRLADLKNQSTAKHYNDWMKSRLVSKLFVVNDKEFNLKLEKL